MSQLPIVFSSASYCDFADQVCEISGFERGKVERKRFPDGEQYKRLLSVVDERDAILIGGTIAEEDTLEVYDLACALVKNGALSLHLILPYYGYSTMERAILPGEVVTAKTRARLLSAIPPAAYGNRVVLLDLHSEGIPHYFEGGIVPMHLYAKPVILETAKEIGGKDYVLACTDSGRAKWVESLANDLGVQASFIMKRRIDGFRTEVVAMNADVEGRTVVIYDDMIRTGGSLINAAAAYKSAGAKNIFAIATHGVLPPGALQKLQDSELFTQIFVTDTHPNAVAQKSDFLQIKSVTGLISEYLLQTLSR